MYVVRPVFWLTSLCYAASEASLTPLRHALTSSSRGGKAQCKSGIVDVHVVSQNQRIAYDGPSDNLEATQLVLELTTRNSSRAADMFDSHHIVDGIFSIYIQLCVPSDSSVRGRPKSVQLLTHGGTLDHNYWDITSGYSYIDAMASSGYATLAYDRLGVGRSSHPDPVQDVQAAAHIEVIHAIVRSLREGAFENMAFEEVIGVGHSVGSYFNLGVVDKYPEDLDGLVLTGVSSYPDYIPISFAACAFQIANTVEGKGFESLSNGYLTPAPLISVYQYNFYHYPNFENRVLLANYEACQTFSIGELLTVAQYMKPSSYTGPAFVVTGAKDFVCCGGDCYHDGDMISLFRSAFLPSAAPGSRSYTVPKTGHNIEGHRSTDDVHRRIIDFLGENGLDSKRTIAHDEL